MRFIIIGFLLLTTACNSMPYQYNSTLKSWIGAKEGDLYLAWGVPSASAVIDDKKIIEYRDNGPVTGTSWNGWSTYSQSSCSTKFVIAADKTIETASYSGRCR